MDVMKIKMILRALENHLRSEIRWSLVGSLSDLASEFHNLEKIFRLSSLKLRFALNYWKFIFYQKLIDLVNGFLKLRFLSITNLKK
jgi:hypothetical protein